MVLLILALLACCSREESPTTPTTPPTSTATTTLAPPTSTSSPTSTLGAILTARTVVQSQTRRPYLLSYPQGAQRGDSLPLIIAFHGFGGSASAFREATNLDELGQREGVLIAYPQGVERGKGGTEWNPYNPDGAYISSNDHLYTEGVIQDIARDFVITTTLAVGYSNGGMMAYGLLCHQRVALDGIGAISATMLADQGCSQPEQIPILVIHGTNDGVLPFDGAALIQSTRSVVDFWRDAYGLLDPPQIDTPTAGITREDYGAINLYIVERGEHDWFDFSNALIAAHLLNFN